MVKALTLIGRVSLPRVDPDGVSRCHQVGNLAETVSVRRKQVGVKQALRAALGHKLTSQTFQELLLLHLFLLLGVQALPRLLQMPSLLLVDESVDLLLDLA